MIDGPGGGSPITGRWLVSRGRGVCGSTIVLLRDAAYTEGDDEGQAHCAYYRDEQDVGDVFGDVEGVEGGEGAEADD